MAHLSMSTSGESPWAKSHGRCDEVQVVLGDGPRRCWPEILEDPRQKMLGFFLDLAWDHWEYH